LTLNGTTHDVSGNVWFDRQWIVTRDLFGKGSDGTTLQDPGISWTWMDINANSVALRVGRQELEYGSGRLIDLREDPNVRMSFDGFKVKGKINS
jgi:hypothetical protein